MRTAPNLLNVPIPNCVLGLALALGTAPWARAQVWQLATPATGYDHAAVAFDAARGVTVAVGGYDASFTVAGTTREFAGGQWVTASTSGPSNRSDAAMAFDAAAGVCVLFGGGSSTPPLGETWTWDGSTWTHVSSSGPPPRMGHEMVYDVNRQRVVLFGGRDDTIAPPTPLGDTWEWDGSSWTQVGSNGPARMDFAMTYDAARDRTVVFGGYLPYPVSNMLGDTWEWDGSTWTAVPVAGPAPRCCSAMTHDSDRGVSVLFGGWDGSTRYSDTWEWNGTAWSRPIAPGPGPRAGHSMAYDSTRDRIVMTGDRWSSNTWDYGVVAAFQPFGRACPGTRVIPRTCFYSNPNASGGVTGLLTTDEFAFAVANPNQTKPLAGFELYTLSATGLPETVTARVYPFNSQTPIATTTMTLQPAAGFYRATFAAPVAFPQYNVLLFSIDTSAQTVYVPTMPSGAITPTYTRPGTGGAWTPGPALPVGWRLLCPENAEPVIGNVGLPRIGTTYQATVSDAKITTGAFLATGFSHTNWNGLALPVSLPNAPGCTLFAAPAFSVFALTDGSGAAAVPIAIPPSPANVGLRLFHQWLVLDPANTLGAVVSDAAAVVIGQ